MSSFRLVYGDYELVLPLNFDSTTEDLLVARLRLAEDPIQQAELAKRVVDSVTTAFYGPTPPSEKQLKYAASICKELGLPLPADCFQLQDSMRVFISKHAPEYQRRKGYRPGSQA